MANAECRMPNPGFFGIRHSSFVIFRHSAFGIESGQYALANHASAGDGLPHLTHAPCTLAPPKGMLRRVACVSALICASHSALPHQPAMTKPGRPSMTLLNS